MVNEKETPRTLVIQDASGKVTDLALMNSKAYQKSLENKVLWVVDPETGRILPYNGKELPVRLETAPFGYVAVSTVKNPVPEAGSPGSESPGLSAGGKTPEELTSPGLSREPILDRLSRVIAARRKEMPEGSYTTHLFRSGPDKIRKKLGEEAVEVILAGTDKEILSESADLIYHLLVLLESLDLSIAGVMKVLEERE